jgi:hypothetical protein
LGAFGLGDLLWAPGGRSLYYSEAREGTPDGLACHWEAPLVRYDPETGASQPLAPGPLSPDGQTLALREGGELVLWDLDTGEKGRLPAAIPDTWIAQAAWDPGGGAVLLLLLDAPDCTQAGKAYLVRASLPDLGQELLLEADAPPFNGFTWETPTSLILTSLTGELWRFDLQERSLSPAE